ncbi:MAG: hypothetical protein DRP45_04210, partial [Candidatus Zixiibacteriota bacterium]
MAKRSKKKTTGQQKPVLYGTVIVLALLILVALISHSGLDNARITGEIDGHLDPFDIQYHNQCGMVGAYLSYFLSVIAGWMAFFLPFGLLIIALRLFSSKLTHKLEINVTLLFVIALLATVVYDIHLLANPTVGYETGAVGGYLATKLTILSLKVFGQLGSYLVAGGMILILLLTYTSLTPLLSIRVRIPGGELLKRCYVGTFGAFRKFLTLKWLFSSDGDGEEGSTETDDAWMEDEAPVVAHDESEQAIAPHSSKLGNGSGQASTEKRKAVIKGASEPVQIQSIDYRYPTLDLLQDSVGGPAVSPDELEMTARLLKETLETFQVQIDGRIETFPGPVITRFE